ncbi:hypothetical protein SAMN04488030_3069 [Aliiroseovarius halocynthiae]|uniref:SRPBCC family protein n=1 Tax=Aliiroseovarius halocynthiae TaxID=985055 RepID=A0A545SMG2_9RHOB|nr:SRPBCC family protein [Aliiroseovarius halocynthiae]TQV66182.1 hypothetical protein FIL88_14085 [Aliiroseovarius halocynthiae]SMR82704.1 hypothetical protein SAMN04488030_3069 [Aliiroseovarius halocynthiae]
MDQDPPQARAQSHRRIALNYLLIIGYCCLVYGVGFFGYPQLLGDQVGIYVTLSIPFSIGILGQLLLDPHRTRRVRDVLIPLLYVMLAVALALLLVQVETLICIAMAVPFFAVLTPAAVLLTRVAQAALHRRFRVSTLYSLTILVPLAPLFATPLISLPAEIVSVREEVLIAAPAETIWRHTVEIPRISDKERLWTISHNLMRAPMAFDARVKGTMRQLRWTKGVRFKEEITEHYPNQRLAWRFVFHDKDSLRGFDLHVDPDSNTLKLLDGWYELSSGPDGTTRLVLESRYRLSTPVNWALKPWGQLFLGDFQRSVLHVIKARAEAGAG